METKMNRSSSVKLALAAAVSVFAATAMTTVPANAEGYLANYEAHVISVAPWDALNMRKWPAYYSQKVSEIPHDGQHVWVQRCVVQPHGSSSDWCKVNYEGSWGWVNKRFLSASYMYTQ